MCTVNVLFAGFVASYVAVSDPATPSFANTTLTSLNAAPFWLAESTMSLLLPVECRTACAFVPSRVLNGVVF